MVAQTVFLVFTVLALGACSNFNLHRNSGRGQKVMHAQMAPLLGLQERDFHDWVQFGNSPLRRDLTFNKTPNKVPIYLINSKSKLFRKRLNRNDRHKHSVLLKDPIESLLNPPFQMLQNAVVAEEDKSSGESAENQEKANQLEVRRPKESIPEERIPKPPETKRYIMDQGNSARLSPLFDGSEIQRLGSFVGLVQAVTTSKPTFEFQDLVA